MFLYLVQHGEAKKEEDDPQRGLTDKGSKDVARTAIYAQELGLKAEYHSSQRKDPRPADRADPGRLPQTGEGAVPDRCPRAHG